ncbi:flagellinolysin [Thalassotalea sp. PLHSN55]|uniref:flagellinolysin n=1 Tax=Thalassotalea sp. PLHSN55 TaxID=3435888 RepID=UPI003F851B4C
MLTLNTNVTNLFLQRQQTKVSNDLETTFSRLSSGMRINSAKDDAAGLQISNRLTSNISGLAVAARNANDGISMAQTAEGALDEVTNILFRMRDLSLQAANGSMADEDRTALNKEMVQLSEEINRINQTTAFGGNLLFDTQASTPIVDANERTILRTLQSGVLAESEDIISAELGLIGNGATFKINLENMDGANGVLASVSYLAPAGTNIMMNIDLDDFNSADADKISQLKSTILHEMVHAVMANNMNLSSTPTWFAEGTAEAISGADSRLASDITNYGVSTIKSDLNGIFTNTNAPTGTGQQVAAVYSGGYVAMRYMHNQLGSGGIQSLMSALSGGASFDAALNTASGGTYANAAAFQTELMGGTVFEDFVSNNMDLTNADNGAFGGQDASGKTSRAETIVGASSASTTTNFSTTFVSGDDDTDNADFTSAVNYGATGLTEVALSSYDPALDENAGKRVSFQVGANANETIDMVLGGFSTTVLALNDLDLVGDPQTGIYAIDDALRYVDSQRAGLGAFSNRMEHTISNLTNIEENLSASRSRIQDTDYAIETAELTKLQIQQQAVTAMMSHSMQQSQLIMQLLG